VLLVSWAATFLAPMLVVLNVIPRANDGCQLLSGVMFPRPDGIVAPFVSPAGGPAYCPT